MFPLVVVGYNAGVENILIVGSGDVARRILSRLARRYRVHALLRDASRAAAWREAGARPVIADLDDRASLHRLRGLADLVLHLAPPPGEGKKDTRTRNLLAALGRGESLPRRLVYVSTTGVYGDCGGAQIDETCRLNPESSRAGRRVDAEQILRRWGRQTGVSVAILRAPGIYAADRLPLERLRRGDPVLSAQDDVYTNHIHAEDLARLACLAMFRAPAGRVYNASDDSDLKMGDYFDAVADAFALPRPPRLPRADIVQRLSPLTLSFMSESRRLDNRRLKQELCATLSYPTIAHGLEDALARRA